MMTKPFPPLAPGDRLDAIELTPERKERMEKACRDLVDWLKLHTQNPVEAHMVLELTQDAISTTYKIKAAAFIGKDGAQA